MREAALNFGCCRLSEIGFISAPFSHVWNLKHHYHLQELHVILSMRTRLIQMSWFSSCLFVRTRVECLCMRRNMRVSKVWCATRHFLLRLIFIEGRAYNIPRQDRYSFVIVSCRTFPNTPPNFYFCSPIIPTHLHPLHHNT